MPIGNGFQAAMVYGNVEKEIFHLSTQNNKAENPLIFADVPDAHLDIMTNLIWKMERTCMEEVSAMILGASP